MLLARRGRGIRRWWPWAVAAVVVVGAGGGTAWALTRGSPAAATQQVLVTVGTGTLRSTVAATGTLEPAQQADLSFPVSGQVTAVPAVVGAHVTAGQVLATLDSASLAATVAQAQATVDADSARLSADSSSGTATSAQLAADQAALDAANSQLANAQQSLSEATLTSPIAGTVAAVNLTVGQQVSGAGGGGNGGAGAAGSAGSGGAGGAGGGAAGATGSGGSAGSTSAQVVVVSTTAYVVDASVDDTVVGQVKGGDQAQITPDGASAPVYGVVSSVGILPSSTSGVPTYPVTITVTGDPPGLYPGASATVSIIVRQLSNVLEVPTAAIRFRAGLPTVTLWRSGAGYPQAITVGTTSGGETQVLSGLRAGEQVLLTRAVPVAGAGAGTAGRAGFGGARGGFGGGGFRGGGFGGGGFGGGGFGGGSGG